MSSSDLLRKDRVEKDVTVKGAMSLPKTGFNTAPEIGPIAF